jgi:hypothetical protein
MGDDLPDAQEKLRRLQVWLDELTGNVRRVRPAHGLSPEEALAALRVVERIINGVAPLESSAAGSVVAHLDPLYGEWAKAPIRRDEISLWEKYGFSPDRALEWMASDLTIEDVPRWHDWGAPQLIARWKDTGISPAECRIWEVHGIDPARAQRWNQWTVGYNIYESAEWLAAFPDMAVPEVNLLMSAHETIADAQRWTSRNIPAVQAHVWRKKGYTPTQASAFVEEGLSAGELPYLKPDHLIPGRQWKKLSAAAAQNGWQLLSFETGWTERERVALFCRGDRELRFRFQGKRFLECREAKENKGFWDFSKATQNLLH